MHVSLVAVVLHTRTRVCVCVCVYIVIFYNLCIYFWLRWVLIAARAFLWSWRARATLRGSAVVSR